jgi:FkbM family methyltransferase
VAAAGDTSHGSRLERSLAAASRAASPLRGRSRLGERAMARAERRGRLDGAWRVRMRDGSIFELPRRSAMAWSAAFEGDYDELLLARMLPFVRPQSVVLDVGASLGLWTVPLARAAAARDAEVWAFEPSPNNTPWIARNVELNGLERTVTIRETGLGEEPGELTLVSAEYGVGNAAIDLGGLAATLEQRRPEKFPSVRVRVERLDDIDLPAPVSFVKIDTEGFEAAFLRGGRRRLERDRPVIFGEFSPYWMRRRGEDLRGLLAASGYRAVSLAGARSRAWRQMDTLHERPVELSGMGPLPGNLLLTPEA